MGNDYRDRHWLFNQYIRKDKTTTEIAEVCGVSARTISDWVERHGIDKRNYWDYEEVLRHLYWDKRMSANDIAEKFDTSKLTILQAMRRHDVERRDRALAHKQKMWEKPCGHSYDTDGYEIATTKSNGECSQVYIHRLLAVAEYGFDVVVDNDVHHKNGVKWDNRPENIEVISRTEHMKYHWEHDPSYKGRWS